MNKPTNKTIIETYLRHFNHSVQSQNMRKSSLNYFFGEKYFNFQDNVFNINTDQLIDYFDWLKTQDISLTTKKNKWTILVSFLNSTMEYYRKYKFIVVIPKHSINWGNGHKKAVSNKNVIATKEEIIKILEYLKTRNYKHYLIVRLFIETGCRKGFMINALYSDVNTEKRLIESNGKTGDKVYYFSKNLATHLEMWISNRKTENSKYLFITKQKKGYGNRAFNLILKSACEQIGITKKITCHTFRRTINTLRKQMGCPNEDRKILLNHKVNDVNIQSYTILEYENFIQLYDTWNPYKELKL